MSLPESNAVAQSAPPVRPWRILSGFAVSGFLLALPGGLLPVWGYHIHPDFDIAANYFLAMGIGLAGGAALGIRLRQKYALESLLAAGCFAGALALLMLAVASPPASVWYQAFALTITGAAAGVVNTIIFECLAGAWEKDPARISLTAGIFFGLGSIASAWLLSECLDAMVAPRYLALAALAPGVAGFFYGRVPLARHVHDGPAVAEPVKDLRTVLAFLFALLLFFQFANEWSMAGWLPVFLIDRLGISPETAVSLLILYWTALTVGRVIAARLLTDIRHSRLLAISAGCGLFGCILLLWSTTRMGVITGILLTGVGFSAIYPLVAERIAARFSSYHPGYFNGMFTFAMLGGILTPFLVGHFAAASSLQVVPIVAMIGSFAVFLLILLIWLGHKVSGS